MYVNPTSTLSMVSSFHMCSLLDILSGRKEKSGLSGEVFIDGNDLPGNFKCRSGYVVQVIVTFRFKGKIRNRFNFISEERVNIFVQNSENLMKIGKKNKEVIWSFANFDKTFLETLILKHRDSFGKGKYKQIKLVLYLIRHYPKYFWTTFTLWTEVKLTIW